MVSICSLIPKIKSIEHEESDFTTRISVTSDYC